MLCLSACSGSGSSGGSIAPEKEIAPSHQQISEPLLRFNVTSHIYNQLFWPSTIKPLVDQIGVDTDMVVLAGDIIPGSWVYQTKYDRLSHDGIIDLASIVEDQWSRFDEVFSAIDLPIYIAPGNHDISSYNPDNSEFVEHAYLSKFGDKDTVIEKSGQTLIFLNTSHFSEIQGRTIFTITDQQKSWLKSLLESIDRKAIIILHHPLWYSVKTNTDALTSDFIDGGYAYDWQGELHPLLIDRISAVIAGECGLNDNNSHHISDNILYYCTASDISRTGYLKISVFEDSIQAEPIYWEHKN